jgi:hypothetical protein
MLLQLDGCALLVQHCSNLGPVLKVLADNGASGSASGLVLHAAIKQYMAAEVDAAASSSSRVVSDGPRRRTLFPRFVPRLDLSLSTLQSQVDDYLQLIGSVSTLLSTDVPRKAITQIVAGIAKQVARELVVEKGSAAYDALMQAALHSGEDHSPRTSVWRLSEHYLWVVYMQCCRPVTQW